MNTRADGTSGVRHRSVHCYSSSRHQLA